MWFIPGLLKNKRWITIVNVRCALKLTLVLFVVRSAIAFPGAVPSEASLGMQVAKVERLLAEGQFPSVSKIVRDATTRKLATKGGLHFATELVLIPIRKKERGYVQKLRLQIDEWVKKSPDDEIAHLFKAAVSVADGRRIGMVKTDSGGVAFTEDNLEVASRHLGKVLLLTPNNPIALALLHRVRVQMYSEDGLDDPVFAQATEALPWYPQAYFYLVRTPLPGQVGYKPEERLEFARRVAKEAPSNSPLVGLVAKTQIGVGRTLFPKPKRDEYFTRQEVFEDVKRGYQALFERFPNAGRYHFEFAVDLDYFNFPSKRALQLKHYTKAGDLDIEDPVTQSKVATWLYKAQEYELSEPYIKNGLKFEPDNGFYHQSLCYIKGLRKEIASAIESCTRAIELTPKVKWNYEQRGYLYGLLGEQRKAEADLSVAKTLSAG